jgi:predicted Zn finger-like uncharacterized protein
MDFVLRLRIGDAQVVSRCQSGNPKCGEPLQIITGGTTHLAGRASVVVVDGIVKVTGKCPKCSARYAIPLSVMGIDGRVKCQPVETSRSTV